MRTTSPIILKNPYGWRATTPEQLSGDSWERTSQVYVEDRCEPGLRKFFEKENAYARQYMLARLLGVGRQGAHRFSADRKTRLLAEFVRSVACFGIGCSANTCGIPRFRDWNLAQSGRAGIPVARAAEFRPKLGGLRVPRRTGSPLPLPAVALQRFGPCRCYSPFACLPSS
ncbi:MAG: cobaltochelatase subunit CobN [Bryobacterales bacterium]|nr:cobaltochelatase subunit CobN [Bryobacterales bacterium]